ncbi:hypothetical protein AmDm5_1938 [Acetobacter malorum]|nr:hypothetical protein AmDm5_1938 [Acetobacter malorum]
MRLRAWGGHSGCAGLEGIIYGFEKTVQRLNVLLGSDNFRVQKKAG